MGEHQTPDYCRKEADIAKMQSELATLNKFVMGFNGSEGLAVSVPKLSDTVQDLRMTVSNLDRNIDRVTGKQDHYEGEKDGKNIIRKRNRWIIGILITVATILLGAIYFLVDQLMNHLPT